MGPTREAVPKSETPHPSPHTSPVPPRASVSPLEPHGQERRGWACKTSHVRACAHPGVCVLTCPWGFLQGLLPPLPLRAGLYLPRDPPWAPPDPLPWGAHPHVPALQQGPPFSLLGLGGAEWFWQPEGPPLLPTCFRPFKLCQRLLPRGCRALPAPSPVQSAALPLQPPPRVAGVSPGTALLRGPL